MCKGFSPIITKDINVFFTEPDEAGDASHSTCLKRLGIKDNSDPFIRHFVRVECPDWTIESFHFDENGTCPAWVVDNQDEIRAKVEKTLLKVHSAWKEYKRIRRAAAKEYDHITGEATIKYEKIVQPAREKRFKSDENAKTKYDNIIYPARQKLSKIAREATEGAQITPSKKDYYIDILKKAEEEYDKIASEAWEENKAASFLAIHEYEAEIIPALKEKDNTVNRAQEMYSDTEVRAREQMIEKLSKITGFVPEKG